ncbi:MAG: hypothetical protein LC793_21920 [Thermomicrobia bacterium]|nr:hypothetical protein [Thermomicrobia bacterium]
MADRWFAVDLSVIGEGVMGANSVVCVRSHENGVLKPPARHSNQTE